MLPILYISAFTFLVAVWNIPIPTFISNPNREDAQMLWDSMRAMITMITILGCLHFTVRGIRWVYTGK